MTEAQAKVLGLPSSVPFAFDIRANGMINQPDFSLSTSWVNAGGVREHGVTRKGGFVLKKGAYYRIPSPIYEIVKASELLSSNQVNDEATRYKALNALQELLPKIEKMLALNRMCT